MQQQKSQGKTPRMEERIMDGRTKSHKTINKIEIVNMLPDNIYFKCLNSDQRCLVAEQIFLFSFFLKVWSSDHTKDSI